VRRDHSSKDKSQYDDWRGSTTSTSAFFLIKLPSLKSAGEGENFHEENPLWYILKNLKRVYTILSLSTRFVAPSKSLHKRINYQCLLFFYLSDKFILLCQDMRCQQQTAFIRNEGRNKGDSLYDNHSWAKHRILARVTYICRLRQFFTYSFFFILMWHNRNSC